MSSSEMSSASESDSPESADSGAEDYLDLQADMQRMLERQQQQERQPQRRTGLCSGGRASCCSNEEEQQKAQELKKKLDRLAQNTNEDVTDEEQRGGVMHRFRLMQHPPIRRILTKLWVVANFHSLDELIDKDEYLTMHRKIVLSLQPSVTPREAIEAAEGDWLRDSEGHPSLDRDRFNWCWFELADLWTETDEPDEYTDFLRTMMRMVVRRDTASCSGRRTRPSSRRTSTGGARSG